MQFWKFALFGITGDLASRKILPALSRFASRNVNDVSIDLVGYSRSQAHSHNIESVLNQSSPRDFHSLNSIEYIQANYDDTQAIAHLFSSIKSNQKLYIYLAVPPQVIIQFLKITAHLITPSIHIIIEKPFGNDSQQAKIILDLIAEHSLSDNIHFVDHYLFKSAARLTSAEKDNFKLLASKSIREFKIQALETLGVEDRQGYYTETGAFKDMFAHIFSLAFITFELLGRSIYDYNFIPEIYSRGQYKTFLNDIAKKDSTIDTYFNLNLKLKPITSVSGNKADKFAIAARLESGKKLQMKQTYIHVEFRDGSVLDWDLAPGNSITYSDGVDMKQIRTGHMDLSDHENMFSDLLKGRNTSFITTQEVIKSWELYDQTVALPKSTNPPFIYKDGKYPLKLIPKNKL